MHCSAMVRHVGVDVAVEGGAAEAEGFGDVTRVERLTCWGVADADVGRAQAFSGRMSVMFFPRWLSDGGCRVPGTGCGPLWKGTSSYGHR